MWRDRTNLFISYRQSYSHHPAKRPAYPASSSNGFAAHPDEERRGLMSSAADFENDGDAVIEMDILPPRWLDIQDEVSSVLTKITQQTKRLEQLHQKHVLPGFDDEDVKRREEREIEGLTQEITRGFQGCQKAIKRIDMMVRESSQSSGGISQAEETMAKNLKISLATRVGEVSATFRKKQAAYLKKLRALDGLASPFDRSSTPSQMQNPYTDPSMLDAEADRSLSGATLQQTAQKKRTGLHDTVIAQREREIEDIAQGIIELANIFQELQTMVIDQGSMLDRIDYNIERTATETKAAHKELKVATTYQKKTTKRKIILLLLLLVVGMFILVLVKPRRNTSSSTPPPIEAVPAVGPPVVPRLRRRSGSGVLKVPSNLKDWRRRRRRG